MTSTSLDTVADIIRKLADVIKEDSSRIVLKVTIHIDVDFFISPVSWLVG